MLRTAIVIDSKDNVATALQSLKKGTLIRTAVGEWQVDTTIAQDIPYGHKVAIKDIKKGTAVIKYGEVIGLATENIEKGYLVHVHNVEGNRGRGDKN
jgi:altronate dehydratase small subunit